MSEELSLRHDEWFQAPANQCLSLSAIVHHIFFGTLGPFVT
jgi:hypothetical protein